RCQSRSDPTLGVVRVRFRLVLLRYHGHAAIPGDLQREEQTRNAAAEDECVDFLVHSIFFSTPRRASTSSRSPCSTVTRRSITYAGLPSTNLPLSFTASFRVITIARFCAL